jgi:hypothetical protein
MALREEMRIEIERRVGRTPMRNRGPCRTALDITVLRRVRRSTGPSAVVPYEN